MNNKFINVATIKDNSNFSILSKREKELYSTNGDARDEFGRDYTRILHSDSYRRLKHKTQVFFNVGNDHICTRMEHVAHVESVSHSIANALGLNTELTRAIAIGHDIGHSPFGHHGEIVLNDLAYKGIEEENDIYGFSEKYLKQNVLKYKDKFFCMKEIV